ncbi:MAG: hypothetical protein QM740_19930 [Acidovorax sp.]
MIVKIGVFIFAVGLAIAAFTSNLFISPKEKSLAKEFKNRRQNSVVLNPEVKYARINILIANAARFLMIMGLMLVVFGYFFY